ncbi:PEP-CTERM sorting domain-containing protein [Roseateles sp. LYH14W]|uniref:PEP-CTERM sorting domain-containing protein n=1 Tax=Pelomonas parva TaxID=3299032 RepID=A0ABW7EWM3_9BURK
MKTKKPATAPRFKLAGVALALGLLQAPAWAVDYIWQGGSGFWDDAGRWTLLGVPGSGDSATIQGTGTGAVLARDPRSAAQLFINGNLATTSTLSVGSLAFSSGSFGNILAQGAGGVMNVSGAAVFDGAFVQTVSYSSTINLGGNATWSQGNGRLSVEPAYSAGSQGFAASVMNIGAGTTFSDLGAASGSGYKIISGTNVHGTYLRTGLGDTYARNVNVTGTLDIASGNFIFEAGNGNAASSSSGLIQVASGSTLGLANITLMQGSTLSNSGLVRQVGGTVKVASGAQIGGAWQVDAGMLNIEGAHAVDSLVMNGFLITGPGTLTTGAFTFNYGKLGGANGSNGTQGGGTLNVTGPATIDGGSTQDVDYNHTLNLSGSTRWTAGNGRLAVATGGSAGPDAHLNIGAGASFTDEGAASASGSKTLIGSRLFTNHGSYLRTGLGETYAAGFVNAGLLQVEQGTFGVDASFSNTGRVDLAAGARLLAYNSQLVSDGLLTGDGTVQTFNASSAFTSKGTIAPGQLGTIGTLTIDGDLTLADSSVLRIDLASGGFSDEIVVTSDALLNGELSLWATPGLTLQLGDTYTIASFGQRLSGSTFDSISWHGLSGDQFSVEYTADSVLLRVTAVPEPATYALWALGLALVAGRKWRQPCRTQA